MKRLICKLFGHDPIVNVIQERVYCKRCSKEGFMQKVESKHGAIIEYQVEDFK